MKKLILSGACALALGLSVHASAEGFDVKDMSCGNFMEVAEESEEVAGLLVFWLDGYLSGVTDDTRFDSEIIESLANDLGEACAENPDASLIKTAKDVGTE